MAPLGRSLATVVLVGQIAGGTWSTGCATGDADGPGIPRFPDPTEIEAIKQQPTPTDEQIFDGAGLDLSDWTFEGALPITSGYETYSGSNIAALALRKHLDRYGRRLQVTTGMSCAAYQLGWFLLTEGQRPSDSLRSFMLARCGAGVGDIALLTIEPNAPASSFSSAELSRAIEDAIVDASAKLGRIPAGSVLGAWVGAHDDQILLMIAYSEPSLVLEPLSMNARGRADVVVRGSMTGRIVHVEGIVTLGEGGFAPCEDAHGASKDVREFALRCPIATDDSTALIDLIAVEKRRAAGTRELTLFVSPDGSMPDVYIEPAAPLFVQGEGTQERPLDQVINELRLQHQLRPIELEIDQSRQISELLPHFIEASRSKARAELADELMWHIVAGTKVTNVIRDADFLSLTVGLPGDHGMARALSRNAAFPMVRSVLLDPDADVIALAMRRNPRSEHAVIVMSTYDHLVIDEHPWLEERFLHELNRAREARGRGAVTIMDDARSNAVLDRALGQLSGGLENEKVFDEMIRELSKEHRDGAVGYSVEVIRPDQTPKVDWPDALLGEGSSVLLRTGYYGVPNSNWVVELLIIAYATPGQLR